MSGWSAEQLAAIAASEELEIATGRKDRTLRSPRIVWVVRNGDELYIRSVNGRDADWFRGVQTRHAGQVTSGEVTADVTLVDADPGLNAELDTAYRRKYGRYPGPTERITATTARDATLRLDRA